jgi:quercetin dioxygenase-like cupin family protein
MKAGSRPTKKASSDWFTGMVRQDPIIEVPEPARVRALKVAFELGARTAWHTHPLGQTLHVVSGVGLVELRDRSAEVIRAGDTVWIPPGEDHWHGATATNSMAHIAIQEALNGGWRTG